MKRPRRKVQKRVQELELAFEAIPESVTIHDRDFCIIWANKAAAIQHGYTEPTELIGRKCHEVFHARATPPSDCPAILALQKVQPCAMEVKELSTARTSQVFVFPYLDPEGEPNGSVHIEWDITRQKEAERNIKIMERLALMGEMAGAIIHEIKNPLQALKTYLYLLEDEREREKDFEGILVQIREAIKRLEMISSPVTAIIRLKESQPAPVHLADLITKSFSSLAHSLEGRKDIEVKIELPSSLPCTQVDPNQMEQVFINILSNALEAMPAGGTLAVMGLCPEKGNSLEVRISDTGIGIKEDDLPYIFDPLFTSKNKGMGLGLALAARFSDLNNASIRVESQPGKGTTIILQLPLA